MTSDNGTKWTEGVGTKTIVKPTVKTSVDAVVQSAGFTKTERNNSQYATMVKSAYRAAINAIASKQPYYDPELKTCLSTPETAAAAAYTIFSQSTNDRHEAVKKANDFKDALQLACDDLAKHYAPQISIV